MTYLQEKHSQIDVIVGLDSRGFLLGPWIAAELNCAFVPIRKKGKLPGKTITVTYQKEYGDDLFEIQKDAITEGQKVIILDDLIATGGSAVAAGQLVQLSGGITKEYVFLIELKALQGGKLLDAPVYSIVKMV